MQPDAGNGLEHAARALTGDASEQPHFSPQAQADEVSHIDREARVDRGGLREVSQAFGEPVVQLDCALEGLIEPSNALKQGGFARAVWSDDRSQAAGGDPDFEAKTPELLKLLYSNVTKYGGSISAEHGIGQVKREQLAQTKAPAILDTMKAIKKALDPKNLMNPGKVI